MASDIPLRSIVESLLFVSDAPLTLDRLCVLLEEYERGDIREALAQLSQEYGIDTGRGFFLSEVADGFQFRSQPALADFIKRLHRTRTAKFSQSALETLAIVAYRQPVIRAEIEYLRGVDCGGVLKTLLEKKLIKILGKKDIPGRPLIYGTTREFLELFNLRDLKSLPSLKEIQALEETGMFEQQEELPLEASPGASE